MSYLEIRFLLTFLLTGSQRVELVEVVYLPDFVAHLLFWMVVDEQEVVEAAPSRSTNSTGHD